MNAKQIMKRLRLASWLMTGLGFLGYAAGYQSPHLLVLSGVAMLISVPMMIISWPYRDPVPAQVFGGTEE